MTPPKARPVGRKASFTAFALQAQSDLLSPSLAIASTSDQEVALSPSPSKRKAGIHDHDDEPQPRKLPSFDLNNTNAPMDFERHEPGEAAPQHSGHKQPTLKLRLAKDTSNTTSGAPLSPVDLSGSHDGSFDSKPARKKLASAAKRQKDKLKKLTTTTSSSSSATATPATPPSQPQPTTMSEQLVPAPAPAPGTSSSEPLSLTDFLASFPAQPAAAAAAATTTPPPAPPAHRPHPTPRQPTPDPSRPPSPHTLADALAMLSLRPSSASPPPFFSCAKCAIPRPLRLLSLAPSFLSPSLVAEGFAPLCHYCASRTESADDGAAQVRWCVRGAHETRRAWHRGMAAGGEGVEMVDCVREGHAGEGEVPRGWRVGRSSSGLWVVEGDGGRREMREERVREKRREKKRRQRENIKKRTKGE